MKRGKSVDFTGDWLAQRRGQAGAMVWELCNRGRRLHGLSPYIKASSVAFLWTPQDRGQRLPLYIAKLQFRYDVRLTRTFFGTIEVTRDIQMKSLPRIRPSKNVRHARAPALPE